MNPTRKFGSDGAQIQGYSAEIRRKFVVAGSAVKLGIVSDFCRGAGRPRQKSKKSA